MSDIQLAAQLYWNFAVILLCSVQNFNTIGQPSLKLWANKFLTDIQYCNDLQTSISMEVVLYVNQNTQHTANKNVQLTVSWPLNSGNMTLQWGSGAVQLRGCEDGDLGLHKVLQGFCLVYSFPCWKLLVNSSPPSASYARQWTGSALLQIMACRLDGAKPMLTCC